MEMVESWEAVVVDALRVCWNRVRVRERRYVMIPAK